MNRKLGFFVCTLIICLCTAVHADVSADVQAALTESVDSALSRTSASIFDAALVSSNAPPAVDISETLFSSAGKLWPLGAGSTLLTSLAYYSLLETGSVPGLDDSIFAWLSTKNVHYRFSGPHRAGILTPRAILTFTDGFVEYEVGRHRKTFAELPDTVHASIVGQNAPMRQHKQGQVPGPGGIGFALLARVIEVAAGKGFVEAVDDLVSTPLGLSVSWLNSTAGDAGGVAESLVPYRSGEVFGYWTDVLPLPSRFWPADGAAMTASDIFKLVQYMTVPPADDPIFHARRAAVVEGTMLSLAQGFSPAPIAEVANGTPDKAAGGYFPCGLRAAMVGPRLYAVADLASHGTDGSLLISTGEPLRRTGVVAMSNQNGVYYVYDPSAPPSRLLSLQLLRAVPAAFPEADPDLEVRASGLTNSACSDLDRTEDGFWVPASRETTSIFQKALDNAAVFNGWAGPSDMPNSARSWVRGFSELSATLTDNNVLSRPSCYALWSVNETLSTGRHVVALAGSDISRLGPTDSAARLAADGSSVGPGRKMLYLDGYAYTNDVPMIYYGQNMSMAALVIGIVTLVCMSVSFGSSRRMYRVHPNIGVMETRPAIFSRFRSSAVMTRVSAGARGARRFVPLRVTHFVIFASLASVLLLDIAIYYMRVYAISHTTEFGNERLPSSYFGCPKKTSVIFGIYTTGIVLLCLALFGIIAWIAFYSKIDALRGLVWGFLGLGSGIFLHVTLAFTGTAFFVC